MATNPRDGGNGVLATRKGDMMLGTARRTTTAMAMGLCAIPLVLVGCSKKEEPVATGNQPGATSAAPVNQGTSIIIDTFAFEPASATAKVNQTVTWTNKHSVKHTITDAALAEGSIIQSDPLDTDQTYVLSFPKAGTYSYICSIHPDRMKGEIVVTG